MSVIIILVTVLASCSMLLQVIARYVFEIAISGLDELTGHIAVWMYMMGAAYGSLNKTQIKAEMVHLFIKNRKALCCIRALTTLIGAVIAGYMVTWSYGYVKWSLLKHEVTPTLQLPTVIFQVSILIGAVLMVIYFLREAVDHLLEAFHPPSATN
ncbi:TRAP transporter small permease [Desulfogranum mediterraneum]|uniref:TRAP transporter small permease n=1 Tax=Desulfogranum mediterraneum TaxID=160661 RepID=UPI0003FD878C|nr:TRAP transporter small permease [Desulfogranum mediterraneum]